MSGDEKSKPTENDYDMPSVASNAATYGTYNSSGYWTANNHQNEHILRRGIMSIRKRSAFARTRGISKYYFVLSLKSLTCYKDENESELILSIALDGLHIKDGKNM